MLVDVVLYGGESELLKMRLDHMKADVTIVLESDYTFTNKYKGFTFPDSGIDADIIFHAVKSEQFADAWQNEALQRHAGMSVLEGLDLPSDAVIGLFDTDEIPDVNVLYSKPGVYGWLMSKYQMSFYWFQRKELTGVSAPWSWLRERNLEQVRKNRNLYESIDAGFHFSSFGSIDAVLSKWSGFAHTEFMRDDMNEWVEYCWLNGVTIESGEMLTQEDALNPLFPQYVLNGNAPDFWFRKRVTNEF